MPQAQTKEKLIDIVLGTALYETLEGFGFKRQGPRSRIFKLKTPDILWSIHFTPGDGWDSWRFSDIAIGEVSGVNRLLSDFDLEARQQVSFLTYYDAPFLGGTIAESVDRRWKQTSPKVWPRSLCRRLLVSPHFSRECPYYQGSWDAKDYVTYVEDKAPSSSSFEDYRPLLERMGRRIDGLARTYLLPMIQENQTLDDLANGLCNVPQGSRARPYPYDTAAVQMLAGNPAKASMALGLHIARARKDYATAYREAMRNVKRHHRNARAGHVMLTSLDGDSSPSPVAKFAFHAFRRSQKEVELAREFARFLGVPDPLAQEEVTHQALAS